MEISQSQGARTRALLCNRCFGCRQHGRGNQERGRGQLPEQTAMNPWYLKKEKTFTHPPSFAITHLPPPCFYCACTQPKCTLCPQGLQSSQVRLPLQFQGVV